MDVDRDLETVVQLELRIVGQNFGLSRARVLDLDSTVGLER